MPPKRKGASKGGGKPSPDGAAGASGAEALQLKQAIDAGQQLDDQTLLTLLRCDTACEGLYSKSCKGKSVNCLCNLIPAPDCHRRVGLWAKSSDAASDLGSDPAASQREDSGKPVGLRNLGNTCYVNSVLQCLFANAAFRRAVNAAAPPLAEEAVVKELRDLFLQMQHGSTDPVDPTPLVAALQLDHAVQQDGQEFMKLFLTLLEARFGQQPEVAGVIQGLFRGRLGYETVCQSCHLPSESSSRTDNFYELDVPVKGFKTMAESLSSLLSPELLDGDNQYSCERCGGKRDATRQLRIRQLPPLLAVSLQRFVFDFQKLDRVKVTDRFAFPLEVDARSLTGEDGGAPVPYDLEAILIHKGGSAMHGHYVAHIKLGADAWGRGGAWWRFDDESVTRMPGGPLGSSDHGAGAGATAAGAGAGAKRKQRGPPKGKRKAKAAASSDSEADALPDAAAKTDGDSDPDYETEAEEVEERKGKAAAGRGRGRGRRAEPRSEEAKPTRGRGGKEGRGAGPSGAAPEEGGKGSASAQQQQQEKEQQQQEGGEIVSSNAYLLLYRRRGADLKPVPLSADAQRWVDEAAARLKAEYDQRCASYASAKAELEARQQERRAEVRSVVEAAASVPEGDPGRFVSTQWLQAWADADAATPLPPVDNSALLCPHGKLDPTKIGAARRVSTHAWEQLRCSHRGGPELPPSAACPACLGDALTAIAAAEDTEELRDRFLAVAAAIDASEAEGGSAAGAGVGTPAFLVSQAWLSAWQKRSGRSMTTSPPTAAITCPHGALAPQALTKQAKRAAIPADFWAFLQRSWAVAEGERQRKERLRAEQAQRKGAGAGGGDAAYAAAAAVAAAADAAEEAKRRGEEEGGPPANGSGSGSGSGSGGEVVMEDGEVVMVDGGNEEAILPEEDEDEAAAAAEVRANGRKRGKRAAPAALPARGGRRGHSAAGAAAGGVEAEADEADAEAAAEEGEGEALAMDEDGTAASLAPGTGGAILPLTEFPCGTSECATCVAGMQAAAKLSRGLHSRREAERAELSHLVTPGLMQLDPGATYHLVPSSFMASWRAYMAQAGGRRGAGALAPLAAKGATTPGEVAQPPSLAEHLARALCDCHPATQEGGGGGEGGGPMLAFSPPAVVNRRGRWVVLDADGGGTAHVGGNASGWSAFELIAPEDWSALVGHYLEEGMPLGQAGIAATLRVSLASVGGGGAASSAYTVDAAGSGEAEGGAGGEAIIGDDYQLMRRGTTARVASAGRGWLETCPTVCRSTVEARDAAVKAARLTYAGEEVMVESVATDEEAAAATATAGAEADPSAAAGERKSKRARKGRSPITVDSTTTLADLKLRIFEAVGVHPRNARIFLRGRPLAAPDDATLALCEVYPHEELRVVDTKEHDADDVASLFPGGGGGKRGGREAERGFTGTVLAGFGGRSEVAAGVAATEEAAKEEAASVS